MPKIDEKQFIDQIRMLKTIKPKKSWADSVLQSIVKEEQIQTNPLRFSDVVRNAYSLLLQRKFAYSLALFAFVIVFLSVAHFTMPGDNVLVIKNLAEQSQATLAAQAQLHQNIANLNNKINDLAQVSKQGKKENVPSVVHEINTNAVALKKSLNETSAGKQEINEIANSLKTLASVSGSSGVDISESPDLKDLYKTVVENQIKDLENSTLTDDQNKVLEGIKDLYAKGEYSEALEMMLEINH